MLLVQFDTDNDSVSRLHNGTRWLVTLLKLPDCASQAVALCS